MCCFYIPGKHDTCGTKYKTIIAYQQAEYTDLHNHDNDQTIFLNLEKKLRNSLYFYWKFKFFNVPAHTYFFVISPVHLKVNLVLPSTRRSWC